MTSIKHILKSLLLPIFFAGLIPIVILFFIELRTIGNVFANNWVFFFMGWVFLSEGVLLFGYCNLLFIRVGKGTLMPLKKLETEHLVIKGPYRYVRNPMIIAVISIIIGEGLLFGSFFILLYSILFFAINAIYIPLREEKYMEKRFGKEFLKYKENVRGWIPRLKPYDTYENKTIRNKD
jgi:protein-S-isoprenylcysteine O-methyltransferase Ste14